jgi:hypothetical protein
MIYHGEIRANSRLVFAIILIIVMMSMILSTVFLSGLTISFATAATETTRNQQVARVTILPPPSPLPLAQASAIVVIPASETRL